VAGALFLDSALALLFVAVLAWMVAFRGFAVFYTPLFPGPSELIMERESHSG
jgi:hypothetical protein